MSGYAKPIHHDPFTCFEESVRNVIDHAREPGFAVAQAGPAAGGDRAYDFAICDAGRGIRQSLSDNPDERGLDARRALELALQKGISGVSAPHRPDADQTNFGIGLFEVDVIAESTSGRFILGSEDWVRMRDGKRVRFDRTHRWKGTAVEITLYLSGFRSVLAPPPKGRLRFG